MHASVLREIEGILFTHEYKWATLLSEVKSDMKTTRKTDANTCITPVTCEKFYINYFTFPLI